MWQLPPIDPFRRECKPSACHGVPCGGMGSDSTPSNENLWLNGLKIVATPCWKSLAANIYLLSGILRSSMKVTIYICCRPNCAGVEASAEASEGSFGAGKSFPVFAKRLLC